jgi:hypothetical protein
MKHAIALIAACCGLCAINGCAKIKGERIEFSRSFPCEHLRGDVYYVTDKQEAARIRDVKRYADGTYPCYGKEGKHHRWYRPMCNEPLHVELIWMTNPYMEGFFGWF